MNVHTCKKLLWLVGAHVYWVYTCICVTHDLNLACLMESNLCSKYVYFTEKVPEAKKD